MRLQKLNDEVLVAEGPLIQLGHADVAALKEQALANERRRIRICAHPTVEHPLHEMLIVHTEGAYVRPHRHEGKSESLHVLEGEADAVFFDDDGEVTHVVPLGTYDSGRRFFYRLEEPRYHTLLIGSPFFVMHEVTSGPFRREETIFPEWAPDENDADGRDRFQQALRAKLAVATR